MQCKACQSLLAKRGSVWVCLTDKCNQFGKITKEDTVENILDDAMLLIEKTMFNDLNDHSRKIDLIKRYNDTRGKNAKEDNM